MDKDLLIQNIVTYARAKGESMSHACIAAGAGKSFISDIKRGRMPSLSKFVDLAEYLGISMSDLVGDTVSNSDTQTSEESRKLLELLSQLNEEGREKLLEYADDLVLSGKYIKNHTPRMGKEA